MFLSEYEYKVDNKGRLPLPPKFRQELRDGLALTKGTEKCITVYPIAEWQKLAKNLAAQTALTRSKQRMLNRSFFGTASSIMLDGQGRIALPPVLRHHAEIEDTVAIIGCNNYIELWNPSLWKSNREEAEEQLWQIIESLEDQQ